MVQPELPNLREELTELKSRAKVQEEIIRSLRMHSGRLHDALQEAVVSCLSQGPYGSTHTLEKALKVLTELPLEITDRS